MREVLDYNPRFHVRPDDLVERKPTTLAEAIDRAARATRRAREVADNQWGVAPCHSVREKLLDKVIDALHTAECRLAFAQGATPRGERAGLNRAATGFRYSRDTRGEGICR